MSTKLFVGGLPWAVTSDQLKDHFAPHGEVVEAKVVTDRQTGRSRGFGFVLYNTEEEAQKALSMDGEEMDGRRIRVEIARDRDDRRGGGGGGGGRRYR
jgi:RNA recognition motif-containing protein